MLILYNTKLKMNLPQMSPHLLVNHTFNNKIKNENFLMFAKQYLPILQDIIPFKSSKNHDWN